VYTLWWIRYQKWKLKISNCEWHIIRRGYCQGRFRSVGTENSRLKFPVRAPFRTIFIYFL
jgi:hypothetical protein